MKLYAVYWREDEDRLDTCHHAWWKKAGALGEYKQAGVFTQGEVHEIMESDTGVPQRHGVVVDLGEF